MKKSSKIKLIAIKLLIELNQNHSYFDSTKNQIRKTVLSDER